MPLIFSIVTIRNGRQKSLQTTQGRIHITVLNIIKKIGNHSGGFWGLIAHIVRKKAFHKTQTNFLIRNIKRIKVQNLIIILYGDITALI